MYVSYVRISCYLNCPYKHYLRYIERLSSNKPARPLSFGKDFHNMRENRFIEGRLEEAWENIKSKYYNMSPKYQSELGENYLEELKSVFDDYYRLYKKEKLPMSTEKKIELELGKIKGTKIFFIGYVDELIDTRTIGECKTFTSKPDFMLL
jgi:ATP-dependent helicase/DNAse subunit B